MAAHTVSRMNSVLTKYPMRGEQIMRVSGEALMMIPVMKAVEPFFSA